MWCFLWFHWAFQRYWCAQYLRPYFESNSSAVFEGAIVRLAGERSLQERRINAEWLTSLCWRNEFSIHSLASRGETSFRKVNTIWQGPTTDAKAQHGTVSKDSTLLSSPVNLLCSQPLSLYSDPQHISPHCWIHCWFSDCFFFLCCT